MVCLDTNIIIYLAKGTLGEDIVGDDAIGYPSIARIESLGYHEIRSVEEQRVRELLAALVEIPLNDNVIELAISLRQQSKMTLGDAIVAASAIESNSVLWTANIQDFAHIDELKLHNPLKSSKRADNQ